MKRTYSGVATHCAVPTAGPAISDGDDSDFANEDMGSYWATALGDDARVHQLFVFIKMIFENNAETAFYKHVDASMTIKDIKDMIKRKKLPRSVGEHPINVRMQISGRNCMPIGAKMQDLLNDDGSCTDDAKEQIKKDNKTLKDVMMEYDGACLLLGHEVVDKDVRMAVVFHWSTVR